MASRSLSCPRCSGSMEPGYIIDESYGKFDPEKWAEGTPEWSVWTGLKLRGKAKLEISTYRCSSCGFLESYATE